MATMQSASFMEKKGNIKSGDAYYSTHFSEKISDAQHTICDQYLIWGNKLPLFVFHLWGNV